MGSFCVERTNILQRMSIFLSPTSQTRIYSEIVILLILPIHCIAYYLRQGAVIPTIERKSVQPISRFLRLFEWNPSMAKRLATSNIYVYLSLKSLLIVLNSSTLSKPSHIETDWCIIFLSHISAV